MSYISTTRQKNNVLVWERTPTGRKTKIYKAPYYFYVKDSKNGIFNSIYGDKLTKVQCENSYDFNQAKQIYKNKNYQLFESDISPELRVLSEYYYEKKSPQLHVTFLDIEVDYDPSKGFSSTENPYAPINSIALYHQHKNQFVVLAVIPTNSTNQIPPVGKATTSFIDQQQQISPLDKHADHKITFFNNEQDLLTQFLTEIQDSDVLSGWNSDLFDIPYIGKRVELLGSHFFKQLSFVEGGLPKWKTIEKYDNSQETLELDGRVSLDYLELFKKYEQITRPSYKLQNISEEILPELSKLQYQGSLADLYRNDFSYFIRYNLRDTEILKGLEQKLSYVSLANEMVHMSTGQFKYVTGTIKLTELAVINHCHHVLNNLIVNDINSDNFDDYHQIQGAYVTQPKTGLHQWIGSIDINSLYPSVMRALNISAETFIGQFTNDGQALNQILDDNNSVDLILEFYNGQQQKKTNFEWKQLFIENNWVVSGYGTVYTQQMQGILPRIIQNWYEKRKHFKKKMVSAKNKGTEYRNNQQNQKAEYFDRIQYVYKIKLNSIYGAFCNRYFRFYDYRHGESITRTGRLIAEHQRAQTNKTLLNIYDSAGNAVIYGDTDSCYFATNANNYKKAIQICNRVQKTVNQSFNQYMENTFLIHHSEFKDIVQSACEIISDKGIFVDKKRYILHIVHDDGFDVDKLKVMGLDTKKTTVPKIIANKINNFMEQFLKGTPWNEIANKIVQYKNELTNTDDIMLIGLPKRINRVEYYTEQYQQYGDKARLPGHVAAAIHYNNCLEKYNDKQSIAIVSGMNIKVFYLNTNVGRFKSIAIPADIEIVPKWFVNNIKIDKKAHIQRLVDNPLNNILKAINQVAPSEQSLFTDMMLTF